MNVEISLEAAKMLSAATFSCLFLYIAYDLWRLFTRTRQIKKGISEMYSEDYRSHKKMVEDCLKESQLELAEEWRKLNEAKEEFERKKQRGKT